MQDKKIKLLDYQIFGLVITMLTLIIAIVLTYNEKLKISKKTTILDSVNELTLSYINRIIILLIALLFLYINYKFYEIAKLENKKLTNYILQIITSYLTIISALVTLYIVIVDSSTKNNNIVNFENPAI